MMNQIFNLTFALVAALMGSPVAVRAYTSDFDKGYDQGQKKAMNIWNYQYGGKCTHISDFEYKVNDYIKSHYWWYSSDSSFTKSFDKGAQAGMKHVLQQYQTHCHDDYNNHDHGDNIDVGMCSGLGKDAASEIAQNYAAKYCPNSPSLTSLFHNQYKEECFEVGLDDCKGAINDEVYLYCGRYIDDYSVLKGLKFKCGYKVSGYIDDSLH
mmetsp:Transcript_8485/g.12395  ORF Transcript_8485/g.12395 Transcript_8485/m.12395 type:complete len:210 (+) Transcript_8485:134-763(+)